MALFKRVAGLQLEVAGGRLLQGREVGEEMRRKMRGCRGSSYLCLGGSALGSRAKPAGAERRGHFGIRRDVMTARLCIFLLLRQGEEMGR